MLPNTLFVGQQLYFLPTCHSTNTEAQQLLIKNEATEGCAIIAAEQTNGRGQRGNTWEAEPHKNITLSVILTPKFLAVKHQFYLTMVVSLAVTDLLRELQLSEPRIKWPNDIFFEDKKLGGILIENSINSLSLQHSIVGIGLNVNQVNFGVDTASSLAKALGKEQDIQQLTCHLLELLEKRYLELRNGKTEKLKYEYLQALYRYQEKHSYIIDGHEEKGQILGVTEEGQLIVEIDQELRYFSFKEITFII